MFFAIRLAKNYLISKFLQLKTKDQHIPSRTGFVSHARQAKNDQPASRSFPRSGLGNTPRKLQLPVTETTAINPDSLVQSSLIVGKLELPERNYSHPPIVPTLQRGNAARDALASRTAGAVLRHSHAKRGNENGRGLNTHS
jgi:hypothetical protein